MGQHLAENPHNSISASTTCHPCYLDTNVFRKIEAWPFVLKREGTQLLSVVSSNSPTAFSVGHSAIRVAVQHDS
eukprot:5138284-Pyramimonas_sp.AAC.1